MNPNSEKLRRLLDARLAVSIGAKTSLEQRKGMACPDAKRLDQVKNIAKASLQFRVHTRHQKSVGSHPGGHGEIAPMVGSVAVAIGNTANRHLHRAGGQKRPNGL